MESVKKINLCENVNLTLINSKKFKTNLVSVYIQRILDKNEATKNALIPNLITNASSEYKSLREISNKLEDLYGASLLADISKRGERQVLNIKLVTTNEKYLDEQIFNKAIEFLNEIINNPLVEDGGFSEEYLKLEKQNLKERIKAKINDKGRYALERCFEEMCKYEKFSISEYGYIDEIDKITAKELYNHYKEILKTSPIDIIVEGEFNEKDVESIIKSKFNFDRGSVIDIPREEFKKDVDTVKNIVDKMDITQGKLVMGYRTNIDFADAKRYYPLIVGCNILGGGPHSKMFINIREKESLCYYIYSSIEKYKGILFISSGIETQNYEKTTDLVKKQIEKIVNGDINDEELNNSKISLISSMEALTDNIGGLSDFKFAQDISKTNLSIEDIIAYIDKVTKEEIVDVFKALQLDTIYFLRN
ncbi:M16 family peptidase [[Clostridium] sordellii]|uniref:EF-P 5-aminopentanol modification-associated protein YfmF n=1 Tax=Paraclostridium sordellii TaxID=1505 RepID=UPI0005DC5651|nr:pitrilysin family protein [Paeniclostridium sordellii]CEQ24349.1 M16 family peptidase [[Clostridium] sordellii] [Paeniclostridium sordellii]